VVGGNFGGGMVTFGSYGVGQEWIHENVKISRSTRCGSLIPEMALPKQNLHTCPLAADGTLEIHC
jgi:hypothetical protein